METGLLWYDDSTTDFAAKVLAAAERHEEKYGTAPNRCYVHPECLPEQGIPNNDIKVKTSRAVLPHHFWIGIHDGRHPSREREDSDG